MASQAALSSARSSVLDSIETQSSPYPISDFDSSPAPSSQLESETSELDGPSLDDWNRIDWKLPHIIPANHEARRIGAGGGLTFQDPENKNRSQTGKKIESYLQADLASPNDQRLIANLLGHFCPEGLRLLLLDWVTYHNLPFRTVDTPRFQRILQYISPVVKNEDLPSRQLLRKMLMNEYQRAIGPVTEPLQTARSQIHFSFDGCTSRKNFSFLGINANFIDCDWRHQKLLLSLNPVSSRHCGNNLADEVADTLSFWKIEKQIGYFTLDNASNNDTAMEFLGKEFDFDDKERRLRCAPHIVHRVVRAMLYGNSKVNAEVIATTPEEIGNDISDEDEGVAIRHALRAVDQYATTDEDEDDEEDISDGSDESDEVGNEPVTVDPFEPIEANFSVLFSPTAPGLQDFRKNGPMGKLHNMGIALHRSSQLHDLFIQAQDWEIIKTFDLILEPFEVVTKQLQGSSQPDKRSTTGAFHEYLLCFELLLDHLEEAIQGRVLKENAEGEMEIINIFTDVGVETRQLIKVFIKLAWQRLDKYYHLMTPIAYVAAVVFHPCKKWRLVEQMWNGLPTRRSVEWTEDYQSRIRALWTAKYKDNPTRFNQPRVNPVAHQSYKRRLNRKIGPYRSTMTQTPATVLDEYERYIVEEPIDSAQFETDPISWWKLNESRFPALSVMAVDFLSILSSSSESERTFSSAGIQSSYVRSRLSRSTISQQQCLRSWGKEGIYEPRVQLDQAKDDFTEHAMDIS
ncbi:hypothetical protein MRS44_016949 [Fusarium solani]|uniref:uncharacterized protein n=1 Tax=Fusarium solani TaxID=169388 RepID=UPI0032C425F6|nr:hypothetical protein MRS44_016949 [Fusarium solani]